MPFQQVKLDIFQVKQNDCFGFSADFFKDFCSTVNWAHSFLYTKADPFNSLFIGKMFDL